MSDPFYSNVALLLHMDGANAGDVFTDNSSYNHTITQEPTVGQRPQTETSVVQYGTAAAFFPGGPLGSGTYIWAGNFSELDLSNTANDYTIECWFQQVAYNASFTPTICAVATSGFTSQVTITLSNGGGFNYLRAFGGSNGSVFDTFSLPKTPITTGVWHFATLTRAANVYYLFLDGTLLGSVTPFGSLPAAQARQFAVGGNPGTGVTDQLYIDDFRLTNGVARYTSSFTPPTGPFPDSGIPSGGTVYGKFLDAARVFRPIQSSHLGDARPRLFQPFENETIKVDS